MATRIGFLVSLSVVQAISLIALVVGRHDNEPASMREARLQEFANAFRRVATPPRSALHRYEAAQGPASRRIPPAALSPCAGRHSHLSLEGAVKCRFGTEAYVGRDLRDAQALPVE